VLPLDLFTISTITQQQEQQLLPVVPQVMVVVQEAQLRVVLELVVRQVQVVRAPLAVLHLPAD
jgi:hypothetical protein